tara:strand:- start:362 stop:637 length:276 start_codon:yes stop_codon:yes gene_type:complete
MKTIKLNQMENKITKKELELVVELQQKLNTAVSQIGILEAQKHSLLHDLAEQNKEVEENKSKLEGKYGAININLTDGSFTSIEQEAKPLDN